MRLVFGADEEFQLSQKTMLRKKKIQCDFRLDYIFMPSNSSIDANERTHKIWKECEGWLSCPT